MLPADLCAARHTVSHADRLRHLAGPARSPSDDQAGRAGHPAHHRGAPRRGRGNAPALEPHLRLPGCAGHVREHGGGAGLAGLDGRSAGCRSQGARARTGAWHRPCAVTLGTGNGRRSTDRSFNAILARWRRPRSPLGCPRSPRLLPGATDAECRPGDRAPGSGRDRARHGISIR